MSYLNLTVCKKSIEANIAYAAAVNWVPELHWADGGHSSMSTLAQCSSDSSFNAK